MRAFADRSLFEDGNLALALAPGLTPAGLVDNPDFFRGFAAYPQVFARGLLVLADVASTRYFNYTPVAQRDPVLSAQGDLLRAECFSACNGVYARLDLLESGFDGEIGRGTTNVDIGPALRTALTRIRREDKLHVRIGGDGFTASPIRRAGERVARMEEPLRERPVEMPDRWVRALGNAADIHRGMKPVFALKGAQAQAFVASLPPATGKNGAAWLTPSRTGVKLAPRRSPGAVYASGLHRLSALKRVLTNISDMIFYMPADGEAGAFMADAALPGARLTFSLTAEAWHGYSGEGALLTSLARDTVFEDAAFIGAALEFESAFDETRFAGRRMDEERVRDALAVLAVSGKLGFDARTSAYFHRELPDDPDRVLKDNPRLIAARKLADAVKNLGENRWLVPSNGTDYLVGLGPDGDAQEMRCTCTWYLNHQNKRGPCKHILAVQLREGKL
ncbi:MAG: SWIM zinc finger domain-containing protein [Clostridiales Family XIII bacterium]|jgi:hypothetical protein|nr:SWIM zinc finger domain-containing protein [Clostridiales Family XIII bacterium]